MSRYMVIHTLPPHAIAKDQCCQLSAAAQNDPVVHGYRSFINLTEGKIVCIFDAPDPASVASWCRKMDLPYDSITLVELEGERGTIHEASEATLLV